MSSTYKYMVRLLYEADYAHVILSSLYLRRPSRDKVQQTLPAIFHAVQVVCMRGAGNEATSSQNHIMYLEHTPVSS